MAQARLRERYQQELVPALMKDLNLENVMQVPRVEKVVVNIGMGEAIQNAKTLDAAVNDLTQIVGQKPVITQGQEVDRGVQGPHRHAHRGDGDAAPGPHV